VDSVVFSEIDPAIASVWKTILSPEGAEWLIEKILGFPMSRESVVGALAKRPRRLREKAFQTILRNRVQRGGIMAPGAGLVKTGENRKGIGSRWYPETLARRIRDIGRMRHRMKFIQADAFDLIPLYIDDPYAVFFVDPPYTAAGKKAGSRLYPFNHVDHAGLFRLFSRAKGAVMLTYDNTEEIEAMAREYGFDQTRVPMKNTHHATMSELVITKGFNQMSLALS
jgi:DNA adenine methylase